MNLVPGDVRPIASQLIRSCALYIEHDRRLWQLWLEGILSFQLGLYGAFSCGLACWLTFRRAADLVMGDMVKLAMSTFRDR